MKESNISILEKIIFDATTAPSADNNQPWQIYIKENSFEIYHNQERKLTSDTTHMFDLMSIGMLIENFKIAAGLQGFKTEILLEDDLSNIQKKKVARIRLLPSKSKTSFTLKDLKTRATNRKSYSLRLVDLEILNTLENDLTAYNTSLSYTTTRKAVRKLSFSLSFLDSVRLSYQKCHIEFFKMLRYSKKEAFLKGDGLLVSDLGLGPGSGLFMRALSKWPLMKAINFIGNGVLIYLSSFKQIFRSGNIIAFRVTDLNEKTLLEAGQAFQHAWLHFTKHNIQLQPLATLPFLYSLTYVKDSMLSNAHRKKLKKIMKVLNFYLPCKEKKELFMLCRIGYASKKTVDRIRLPLETVSNITDNSSSKKYSQAVSRNLGLISKREQEIFKNSTIGIPGMGGVGGIHLATLARLGIGGFHIADSDEFSLENINRQYGALYSSVDKCKVEVMTNVVKDINPNVRLKTWKSFINESNVDDFLENIDILIDSVDAFAFDARRLIYSKARLKGIPIISAGPIGLGVSALIYTPDSMPFDTYINYKENMNETEKFVHFLVGLCPKLYFKDYFDHDSVSGSEKRGPSVASAVNFCAGYAATQVIKLLTNQEVKATPYYHYFCPYTEKFGCKYLPFGNRHPIQKLKINKLTKLMK